MLLFCTVGLIALYYMNKLDAQNFTFGDVLHMLMDPILKSIGQKFGIN